MEKQGKNLQIDGKRHKGHLNSQDALAKHKSSCDGTDLEILRILQRNARTPFLEVAREVGLSGATIHERVRNMREGGIIEAFTTDINLKKLGYEVTALVDITLEHSSLDLKKLKEGLLSVPEITEAHNLTGDTDLLLKIRTKSIDDLRQLLTDKIQYLEGVKRMSTGIILDSPVDRKRVLL